MLREPRTRSSTTLPFGPTRQKRAGSGFPERRLRVPPRRRAVDTPPPVGYPAPRRATLTLALLLVTACVWIPRTEHEAQLAGLTAACEPAIAYADSDGDGFGAIGDPLLACIADGYVQETGDCDDDAADVHPEAVETCDGRDEDCDGEVDQGASAGTYYGDSDGDGYGDSADPEVACVRPAGAADDAGDCDDDDPFVYPGAADLCDGTDTDCDGGIDEDAAFAVYYEDEDADGYGDATTAVETCEAIVSFVGTAGDCDDTDETVNAGGTEVCNSLDDDCDGQTDDDDPDLDETTMWFPDADGDGYGAEGVAPIGPYCLQPEGYADFPGDCDDADPAINVAADEVCNDGVDDNCNRTADDDDPTLESASLLTWFTDADGDGVGDAGASTVACAAPAGYVDVSGDCDDNDAALTTGC